MHVIGKELRIQDVRLVRSDYLQATGVFLLSRVFLYLMVYFGLVHYPNAVDVVHTPVFSEFFQDTMRIMCNFDCKWFVDIAVNGYQAAPDNLTTGHAANWAILPAFPLLGRYLAMGLGLDVLTAFYLIANVSFFVALLLWLKFLKFYRFTPANRSFALFFLCFLPYGTYYLSPYTESLFLALSLGAFINAYQGRFILAALCAMGMTATKNIGVMFVFPLIIIAWQQLGLKELFNIKSPKTWTLALAIMLIPLPLFGYQNFLFEQVGDAMAFKNIQLAWGRELDNPFEYIYEALNTDNYKFYFACVCILGLIMSLYLLYKKRLAEAVFLLLGIMIPVSTGINAVPRYIFGLVPALLAIVYITDRHPWLRNFVLATGAALSVYFAIAWGHGMFFTI